MKLKTIYLIVVVFIFLFTKNVLALELTMEYENNPYYYRSGEGFNDSSKLTFYNLDSEVVYCVEPGVHITDSFYQEIDFNKVSYSKEKWDLIKKIGYYGYEYPGRDNINYRIATQALIWENLKNISVSFWSQKNQSGNLIDVSYEKEIIMNDVARHGLLPNIANDIIMSIDNEEILEDDNQILNSFEIINSLGLDTWISDNSLHIKSLQEGDYEIILKKKKYDNKISVLYEGDDGISQKLAKLRIDDDIIFKINIHIVSGKLNFQKLDADTKSQENIGNISLEGAEYGLYKDQVLIKTFKTLENGLAILDSIPLGRYLVKELKPSYGYELDLNSYEVIFSKDNLEVYLEVLENPIKKELILIKTLETDSSILEPEKDITFQIYEKNKDVLYQEITTDLEGISRIELPYGDYIIKQINTTKGYLCSENLEIHIDENTNHVLKVLEDKLLKFRLKLIKIDMETGEVIPISGFSFQIKNLETNEFIQNEIDNDSIFTTNSNGEFISPLLKASEYEIYEINSPTNDYKVNLVPMKISIYDENLLDKGLYVVNFSNIKEEIVVPNTGLDEKNGIKLLACFFFLLSIFCFYKINNKNLSS